jgi:uncharacterized protein
VGDLERRYEELGLEEDFFINYGFLAAPVYSWMHPRSGLERHSRARARQAEQILDFVRSRGAVHPREVERHLGSGKETNYWGGSSNVTTRLLDNLHYRGFLRVARRDAGIRVYTVARSVPLGDMGAARRRVPTSPSRVETEALDSLVDLVVRKYAPLPAASLSNVVGRLRHAVPQWRGELRAALLRAKQRLATAHVGGVDWYWPPEERVRGTSRLPKAADDGRVRLLSPFDPVVWDRRRFELFWDWAYRFEAYTPISKRKLGYYALPLLWGERALGWANLTVVEQRLSANLGYVAGKAPRDPAFRRALAEELARFERFLSLS